MSSYVIQSRSTNEPPAGAVAALARVMTARDGLTHAHSVRVQRYAVALAREAGVRDERLLSAIDTAALLHDIGKLAIPDALLHKPGPLSAEEYEQVKQHATIGAEVLAAIAFPFPLTLIVRHHHENWDGTGYPDRLRGDAIPVGARVLSLVDCYDALTSDRPYRAALSHGSALAMIHERRGTMYDPAIVDAFLRIVPRLRSAGERELAARQAQTRASLRVQARAV
jgi:putative nucleotidyltransferase with HDIG domain